MNQVQPMHNGLSDIRPSQTEGAAKTQQTGGTAATIATSTSTVNVSMVHVQVNEMLGAIGGDLQSNHVLKMVIGLMILQALLANDGGNQQGTAAAALLDLLGQSGSSGRCQMVSLQSATNMIQIEQQSTMLEVPYAAPGTTPAGDNPGDTGSNIDLYA